MLYLILFLLSITPCAAGETRASGYQCGSYVEEQVWESVFPYLLPVDFPIKEHLDALFSSKRVTESFDSLKEAGFTNAVPRRRTFIIVTKHPDFPGYVFKLFVDEQPYHKNKPEHKWWIDRIDGVQRIQEIIDQQDWNEFFKTPKKWIYQLPDYPSPPQGLTRKNFILIEEDMQILDLQSNEEAWKNISFDLLEKVYFIVETAGLRDSKIDNIPFSYDGKLSFLDTQEINKWPVAYHRIARFLSGEKLAFWLNLVSDCRKKQIDQGATFE